MPTRNVVLTDHQSALIDRLVEQGRYQNASEAIRAGLRHVEREEQDLLHLTSLGDAILSNTDGGNETVGNAADEVRQAFRAAGSDR